MPWPYSSHRPCCWDFQRLPDGISSVFAWFHNPIDVCPFRVRFIPDDEKAELRSAIIQLLRDPSVSVANIMTTTLARIVKYEFPDVWPGIFADLCHAITSSATAAPVQNRLLQALRACCRTIAHLIHEVLSRTSSRWSVFFIPRLRYASFSDFSLNMIRLAKMAQLERCMIANARP